MPPFPQGPPSRPASPSSAEAYPSSSHPLAAQIPLKSFALPEFPPEAFQLRELTLTCDIKLDEYQSLLHSQSSQGVRLPNSITSLTLELFWLGYPPAWLTKLGEQLPNLKTLTVFSGLIDGLDDRSRKDANTFFQNQTHLKELHLIDTFVRPGFWTTLSETLQTSSTGAKENRIKFIEVSYTYRGHSDPEFMSRTIGEEVPVLLLPGMVAASFNLEPPQDGSVLGAHGQDTLEDPANLDKEGKLIDGRRPEGILPFPAGSKATNALMKRLREMKNGMRKMRLLNLSLWTLSCKELEELLRACMPHQTGETDGLAEFCVCIEIGGRKGDGHDEDLGQVAQNWWKTTSACLKMARGLEGLEIVGVPSKDLRLTEQSSNQVSALFPSRKDLEDLALSCPRLQRFEMSTLRTKSSGYMKCFREIGKSGWTGGLVTGKEGAGR